MSLTWVGNDEEGKPIMIGKPESEPPVRSSDVVSLISEIQEWANNETEIERRKPRSMQDDDRLRVLSNIKFHLSMCKGYSQDVTEANAADQRPGHTSGPDCK